MQKSLHKISSFKAKTLSHSHSRVTAFSRVSGSPFFSLFQRNQRGIVDTPKAKLTIIMPDVDIDKISELQAAIAATQAKMKALEEQKQHRTQKETDPAQMSPIGRPIGKLSAPSWIKNHQSDAVLPGTLPVHQDTLKVGQQADDDASVEIVEEEIIYVDDSDEEGSYIEVVEEYTEVEEEEEVPALTETQPIPVAPSADVDYEAQEQVETVSVENEVTEVPEGCVVNLEPEVVAVEQKATDAEVVTEETMPVEEDVPEEALDDVELLPEPIVLEPTESTACDSESTDMAEVEVYEEVNSRVDDQTAGVAVEVEGNLAPEEKDDGDEEIRKECPVVEPSPELEVEKQVTEAKDGSCPQDSTTSMPDVGVVTISEQPGSPPVSPRRGKKQRSRSFRGLLGGSLKNIHQSPNAEHEEVADEPLTPSRKKASLKVLGGKIKQMVRRKSFKVNNKAEPTITEPEALHLNVEEPSQAEHEQTISSFDNAFDTETDIIVKSDTRVSATCAEESREEVKPVGEITEHSLGAQSAKVNSAEDVASVSPDPSRNPNGDIQYSFSRDGRVYYTDRIEKKIEWQKPSWTKQKILKPTPKGEELKAQGTLEKPITFPVNKGDGINKYVQPTEILRRSNGLGEKDIGWEKPEWTKKPVLKTTDKGCAIKMGVEIVRPITADTNLS